jgi:hypothetical protein
MAIDTTRPRSRRALLAGTLGGLVALAAQAIGRPPAVSANDPNDVLLGHDNIEETATLIYNTSDGKNAIEAVASASGTAVLATSSSGSGVDGRSAKQVGVYGSSGPGAPDSIALKAGVYGWGPSTTGLVPSYGVYGKSISALGWGVVGTCDLGTGVLGMSLRGSGVSAVSRSGSKPAVLAHALGSGTGAIAWSGTGSTPAMPLKTGVLGFAAHDDASVGIHGTSPTGRGGVFEGKTAQLRLSPSSDQSHPDSGAKGDLFVDTSGRLWFCKHDTNWVRLA